ncbi:hypothetical protein XELAEV_18007065mg [Xenopus laevis]|uniref:Uncharacterized protein n=1 Tax=Xenopus laevis TaxID=8355 RepID=A0A974DZS1_XENLA|nr:hypothetical protein XELAEV_18007065mg [Xenopus laevis]
MKQGFTYELFYAVSFNRDLHCLGGIVLFGGYSFPLNQRTNLPLLMADICSNSGCMYISASVIVLITVSCP